MTERDHVEGVHQPTSVVRYDDVRGVLAGAWPDLAGPLDRSDEAAMEDDLHYLEMSAIARYLGARRRAGESDCFDQIFEAVEHCLLAGSDEAVELVMVGLLEDLQNANITGIDDYSQWEPHLRPQTRLAWKAVSDFWDGRRNALKEYDRGAGQRWTEKTNGPT